METIRILQVVTAMNRGGLETMLMNYYRQLKKGGIQFDFMVHRAEKGDYDEEIAALGGRRYVMPAIRPGGYRSYFAALRSFFEKHREYGIVHAHLNENSAFVLKAAKEAGITGLIAHSHMSDLEWDYKLPFRLYARAVLRSQPGLPMACSARAGDWLYGRGNKSRGTPMVLPNAVNLEEYARDDRVRLDVRRELNAENRLVLGHVGRFCRQKNHDFLLRVFREVLAKNKDALLLLAGDGPLRSSAMALAKRLGISENVVFLGVRNDISRLLQGMDLFLMPSRYEGLPLALVEAQAAGLRCVVSDSITREADLTGNVVFIPLKAPLTEWSRQIGGMARERTDTRAALAAQGYDCGQQALRLEQLYRRLAAEGARLGSGLNPGGWHTELKEAVQKARF
jgi:glycosyltransferase involved in cell wall biosynthesis